MDNIKSTKLYFQIIKGKGSQLSRPLEGCPASTRKSLKLPLTYAGDGGDFEQLMV